MPAIERSRTSITRLSELMAAVGLAAASAGMWFLWPRIGIAPQRQEAVAPLGTRFALLVAAGGRPAMSQPIVLPSRGLVWEDPQMPLKAVVNHTARILERNPAGPPPIGVNPWNSPMAGRATGDIGRYEPVPLESTAFGRGQTGAEGGKIRIMSSRNLPSGLFDAVAQAAGVIELADEPWTIKALVGVNKAGEVSDVFLLSPSGSEALNTAIVGLLYRGRVGALSAPCDGTVTISWPGPGPEIPPK